jgi:nucleoside-diphosphate-sugar epimerase
MYQVTGVDNLMYGQRSIMYMMGRQNLSFHRWDARSLFHMEKALEYADIIVWLPAIVGAPACAEDHILAQDVNYECVRRIIERVSMTGQRFLYPNTNSGYGRSGVDACTEETELLPRSHYALTKKQAESLVLEYDNSVSLRLATVFGVSPRMRTDLMVNDFTLRAVTEGTMVMYEPDARRNFVHVADVAACFEFFITNDRLTGVYNFGNDAANMTKRELAKKITEHVPKFRPVFEDYTEDADRRDYIVSSAKLAEEGFSARVSVDAGVAELVKAYQMLGVGEFGNAPQVLSTSVG